MMGSICHLIGTNFDLLNPNFDKFIHFPNFDQILGLKGQKLSKFVEICKIRYLPLSRMRFWMGGVFLRLKKPPCGISR